MTLVERLTRARRRLAGDGWRLMPMDACDRHGRWCPADSEEATHFSIVGALTADGPALEAWDLLDSVSGSFVMQWEQQQRTTSDVQQLLARAIARAQALERRRGNV